ncbi:MAG TPA: hypothetical protein VLA93_11645 [Pyrinomonadaceae bacterium]|nr:hypothetical protein [Pyrinomonadaceae bacterium]
MTFRMDSLLTFLAILFFCGCKGAERTQTTTTPSPSPAASASQATGSASGVPASAGVPKAKTDACALLTSAEIELIQKEAVKETKLSGSSQGGFSVSQCFFMLPTFNNSISLQVTQRAEGPGSRDPKEFWQETFHRESKSEKEHEREKREKKEQRGREEEEEEVAPPQKIPGVGDDAFWIGTRIGGALYVLKGNSYLRVSIGGPGPQADKIQRLKSLAQRVAERL